MACLQNGATLLNNNNLSSFKHNIMKYDETHPNVWSSSAQMNNYLSNQIPFRNNFAKDKDNKTQSSDSNAIFEDKNSETSESNLEKSACEKEMAKNKFPFSKQELHEETGWLSNKRNNNLESSDIYKDSSEMVNKESDKTISNKEGFETSEPSHHARRPMNAFLIFCKRHRTIVKNHYPHLENRAVTKILGEWWAGLELEDKSCYTELAKQVSGFFVCLFIYFLLSRCHCFLCSCIFMSCEQSYSAFTSIYQSF